MTTINCRCWIRDPKTIPASEAIIENGEPTPNWSSAYARKFSSIERWRLAVFPPKPVKPTYAEMELKVTSWLEATLEESDARDIDLPLFHRYPDRKGSDWLRHIPEDERKVFGRIGYESQLTGDNRQNKPVDIHSIGGTANAQTAKRDARGRFAKKESK